MLPVPATFVRQVVDLHRQTVVRWHAEPLDNPYAHPLALICRQHQFNYLLWHEEDIARSPHVSDSQIAQVKRAIDRYNQQRNDGIEAVDQSLIEMLTAAGVSPAAEAPLNTETPGAAIDRLSILQLRIYHLEEQEQRTDVDAEHREKVAGRLAICRRQLGDLSGALTELVADLFAGRKRLQLYRQLKMYNDPTLNPYLYGTPLKQAG